MGLKYFKRLKASAVDELPSKLPASTEDVDFGASNFSSSDWDCLKGLKNLKRVDLRGVEGDISGKCPLPSTLKFLDVEATNFDDTDFLQKLKDNGCKVNADV